MTNMTTLRLELPVGLGRRRSLLGTCVVLGLGVSIAACGGGNSPGDTGVSSQTSGATNTGSTSPETSASTSSRASGSGTSASGTASTSTPAGGSSSGSSTADACTNTAVTQSGGTQYCSNSQGNIGTSGYSYQLWSNGQGTGCMTVFGTDATFKANWSAAGDFLARVGLGFNSSKTPAQIGTIGADFAETKTGTAAYSNIGIYGWSVNPLHEYYIVEDWFGSRPVPGTAMGTITVDGGTYDVYTHTQNNQPAITGGNATFVQFLSVRTTARSCGHISISEHFSQWATLGMQLGNLEEARILMEAGGNATGTIDFTAATMTVTAN